MGRLSVNRERGSFDAPSNSEWGSGTLSPADVRKAKLAFTTLFVFLLAITFSYEWNGRARLIETARREMFLQNLEVLGEQCIAEEEYLGAIVVFETLLETSPESQFADEALCRVGLCWLCLDNSEGAMEAWERFLKLYPESEYAPKVRESYLSIVANRSRRLPV